MTAESRFQVPLEELEASAHVAEEDQVIAVPEPPGEGPLAVEELNRARALSPTGDFRLHP
jgi:hypothetical protein